MRILIIRTFPSIIDLSQYNVQEIGLAKALVRAGHICDVVLYNGKNPDCIEEVFVGNDIDNIKIYKLHGYNFLKNGIFPTLKKIISGYDILQVNEYDQISSWMYYAWSEKPVIIYHGPYYHSFNKKYNTKCKIFDLFFLNIKNKKDVVCLTKSQSAADFLRRKGFHNVTPVGVGVNPDTFYSEEVSEIEISVPQDKFNLLYVGKIEKRRNPEFLLEVMEKMCQLNEKINCIVIGSGEKNYIEKFLHNSKKMLEQGRLQYYPKATQSQLAQIYQKAQVMLFPSRYEIFGMVLLEALYFNLPIISTCNGGSDMLISHNINGFVMDVVSSDDWCELIQSMLDNKEYYNEIRQNIMKMNKNMLFWDGLVPKFVEAYQLVYKEGN